MQNQVYHWEFSIQPLDRVPMYYYVLNSLLYRTGTSLISEIVSSFTFSCLNSTDRKCNANAEPAIPVGILQCLTSVAPWRVRDGCS